MLLSVQDMNIRFEDALPHQALALSDLAIESKGHWGYSRAQLESWRELLRIEEAYISQHCVQTILLDDELIGFFAIKREETESILDHLWLLPKAIGRGIGRAAFTQVKVTCIEMGIREFILISDPDAEGFYLHQGCKRIGEVESIPQKRMLPQLKYTLEAAQAV